MSMNIGTLKANEDSIHIGRIVTMHFAATVALREVNSTNDRAPAFDVMGLSADRRSWVKIGALWEYNSTGTGECFLSGRLDDPSLDKPLDVALFRQEDGSYNVAWRRPVRKRTMPTTTAGEDSLPPMDGEELPVTGGDAPTPGGDGLGESTAPAPRKGASAKQKETADA